MTKEYRVTQAGDIYGKFREVGDKVNLTPAQAKYLLTGGQIAEDAPAPVRASPSPRAAPRAPRIPAQTADAEKPADTEKGE